MEKINYLILFLLFVLSPTFAQQDNASFNVTYVSGHQLKSKPSLQKRICGTKEIQLFVPHNMSSLDHFVYDNIGSFFKRLGLKVEIVKANFRNRNVQISSVYGVWTELDPDEDLGNYLRNANTLCIIPNYVNAAGQYLSRASVHVDIVDYMNNFVWNINPIDIPNSGEKFINRLSNSICSSYYYNDTYSYQPSYYTSTWNKTILKDNIDKKGADPIEGIYKGDKYTLGVKRDTRNGTYYMIYLDGSENDDWKEGDIKALLKPTATPTIFKADWYGKWKQKTDYTISFANGGFALIYKNQNEETYIKMYPTASAVGNGQPLEWTGTGFALKNNYIVTNYHVVDGAKTISVKGINGSFTKEYDAEVVASDKQNDLAILKVNGVTIPSSNIPYSVKTNTAEVGEEVFVLGYPLTSTMGEEIKLTTGVVSSRSGFQGDVSLYQTTAPIQPGNSGGPLFDSKGNVIGIVSAKHRGAENVGYAIKASYLRNLMESALPSNILPQTNRIANSNLSGKVKSVKNYVFYITCSSHRESSIQPAVQSSTSGNVAATKVTGYRVQLFKGGGSKDDRIKAENIARRIKDTYPNEPVYVHFYSPNWICRVGNYVNYEDAKKMADILKDQGFNPTIVKGKIAIR